MKTSEELVTVVITTCNRDMETLQRAINSVLKQTYEKIELYVINDAPSKKNEIEQLLKKISNEKIIFLSNETQRGACYSRNRGLQEAKGIFIAYLDDDDEWYETKIEKQVEAMRPFIGLVYSNYVVKSLEANIKPDKHKVFFNGDVIKPLIARNFIGGCSVPLLRTSIMRECGGFDVNFKSSQDFDMWIRMAQKSQVVYVDEILSVYYVGNASITGGFESRMQGWNALLSKYHVEYEKYPKEHMQFVCVMINEAAKRKNILLAIKMTLQSFKHFPNNVRCVFALMKGIAEKILAKY